MSTARPPRPRRTWRREFACTVLLRMKTPYAPTTYSPSMTPADSYVIIQNARGHRVKTDAKDAVHLARLLRLGEVVAVAIPSVDQEAARTWFVPGKTAAVTSCAPGTDCRNC